MNHVEAEAIAEDVLTLAHDAMAQKGLTPAEASRYMVAFGMSLYRTFTDAQTTAKLCDEVDALVKDLRAGDED